MPLPNANKKSPRVYPLLQNTDLENLAYATLQSTGQPIAIEEQNEDELLRLVLVMLARMSVKGEWNGLLSAGSGGTQYALEPIDASELTTYTYFVPWGRDRTQSDAVTSYTMEDKAVFTRFIAPKAGTMGDFTVRTSATNTSKDDFKAAIYSTTNGLPGTLIGAISIDINGGSGQYTSSSWSTTPTLTAGTTYWLGVAPEGSTKPAVSGAATSLYLELGITHYPGTGYTMLYNNGGTNYDLPSSVTDSDLTAINGPNPVVWGFKYA